VLCGTDRVPVLGKPTVLLQSMNLEKLNTDNDYGDESIIKTFIIRIMKNLRNSENLRNSWTLNISL
jgi:hypothetical protein